MAKKSIFLSTQKITFAQALFWVLKKVICSEKYSKRPKKKYFYSKNYFYSKKYFFPQKSTWIKKNITKKKLVPKQVLFPLLKKNKIAPKFCLS